MEYGLLLHRASPLFVEYTIFSLVEEKNSTLSSFLQKLPLFRKIGVA